MSKYGHLKGRQESENVHHTQENEYRESADTSRSERYRVIGKLEAIEAEDSSGNPANRKMKRT